MEVSLMYDADRNIYFKTITGVIHYGEITKSMNDTSPYNLNKNNYLLVNLTNARFDFPLIKLSSFINQSQKELPGDALIFHAIVTSSKTIIAFAGVIKALLSSHRYFLRFSPTEKQAIEWLIDKQKVYGTVISQ